METNITIENIKNEPIPADTAFQPTSQVSLPQQGSVPSPIPMVEKELSFNPMIQEQQNIANQAGQQRQGQLNSIAQSFARLAGLPQQQIAMEEQAGIPDMMRGVQEIDSLMQMKSQRYRNELETLEGGRGTITGIRNAQNQLNIQATRELANLAIVRDSQLGRLNAAKEWVARKVEAETAQAQMQLEATKFFYNENKEILTKAQDRAFSLKIAEQERQLTDEKEKRQQVNNMALQAAQYGASPEVVAQIGNAPDAKTAISMATKYLGEPFRLQVDMQEFQKRIQSAQLALARDKFQFEKDQMGIASYNEMITQVEQAVALEKDAEKNIKRIDEILKLERGIESAAGVSPLGRTSILAGGIRPGIISTARATTEIAAEKREFVGAVSSLLDSKWIKEIQDAKAKGATFGSLDMAEGARIGNAADELTNALIRDPKTNQAIGFNASPEYVIRQINEIRNTYNESLLRRADQYVDTTVGSLPNASIPNAILNAGYSQ